MSLPVERGVRAAADAGLVVLVVDDDYTNRLILKGILEKEGYRVVMAENGAEAVETFAREAPGLVLMDIMMPVMDGYEATRQIKQSTTDTFVPVIFLTAVYDENALAQCVEAGGDDFLTKPYNRVILKAKIDAMQRVRQLYCTLKDQRDELNLHHSRLQREHEIAEIVFANIVQPGCLDAKNIRYLLSPVALNNGDLLLAARKPSGGQHLLLGDLTGHGLSAAIGAMPVSESFYRMTEKGYSVLDVVTELNQKLKDRLPTGLFLAATLLELDASHSTLVVWNGGLPDVLVYGANGRIKARIPSRHLPLGVVDSDQLNNRVEIIEVEQGDRVFVYSDGLIEAVDLGGRMFGQERLEALIEANQEPQQLFDEITGELERFRNGAPQSDDITLIEVACDTRLLYADFDDHPSHLPGRPAMSWGLSVNFGADALRQVDPLPQLIQLLAELQGLEEHRARLYTVLAELFSNALEHGVLRLDSSLKRSPHGFSEYYTRRQLALQGLQDGWVRVDFEHRPVAEGGELTIRIEDSGPGFTWQESGAGIQENTGHCGRGIALVRSLCRDLTFQGDGSRVEARYVW